MISRIELNLLPGLLKAAAITSTSNHISIAQRRLANGAGTSEVDKLFPKIQLEVRGHDKAVLNSYMKFVQMTCQHLDINVDSVKALPYVRWLQNMLKSKFAKKKNQLHYETRTHIRQVDVNNLTGSTTNTFLEYIERNIPEGVAMKVTYHEAIIFPKSVQNGAANSGNLINGKQETE